MEKLLLMKGTVTMVKKLIWIKAVLGIALLIPVLSTHAQDDGGSNQDTLDLIITAYQNTAVTTSYIANSSEETDQSISLQEGDVLFVIRASVESEAEAQISGDNGSATIAIDIEQSQEFSADPSADSEILEDSEAELEAQLISIGDDLFVNMDETNSDYRVGVTEGWQMVVGDVQILSAQLDGDGEQISDGFVSIENLNAAFNNARLDVDAVLPLLDLNLITQIEILDDDEIEEQVMQRYLLTFEAATVLDQLEFDPSISELPDEIIETLINSATYSLEVWIGADDQLVRQQIFTLELDGEFPSGTLDGDLSNVDLTFTYTMTQSLELRAFGEAFDISRPVLETEILG